jgi:molecular chaperone IbpA
MTSIDLTPLYRSSIGFDRLAAMLDATLRGESAGTGYPPYDIEVHDENQYAITLAVAGFEQDELDVQVEKGVLTIRGTKENQKEGRQYVYQGIATGAFERKFNLADFVQVTSADLHNGLLTINLLREIPEQMKPRTISINRSEQVLEHQDNESNAA